MKNDCNSFIYCCVTATIKMNENVLLYTMRVNATPNGIRSFNSDAFRNPIAFMWLTWNRFNVFFFFICSVFFFSLCAMDCLWKIISINYFITSNYVALFQWQLFAVFFFVFISWSIDGKKTHNTKTQFSFW